MRTISAIKLVAVDLDGTLLGPDLKISPRTRAAISAARVRGVHFVIATGRMYQSAAPYARELELEGAPLVAYNGALVREFPSGRTVHHEPVPVETCLRAARHCEDRGYHVQAYVDDQLHVPDLGLRTEQYVSVSQVRAHPVGPLSRWLKAPSTKMLVVDEPERIEAIQADLRELLGPSVSVVQSYPLFLEIVSSKVSKGTALQATAEALGLGQAEVAAVGDAANDLPMLAWAGVSFAMAHAPERVKRAAAYVTESAPGDGVAEALERLGLV